MTKYIIVKIDSETKIKSFLKVEMDPVNYIWTNDIDQATKYDEYHMGLNDWFYASRWYNPNGDRIEMQTYDENQPPWE